MIAKTAPAPATSRLSVWHGIELADWRVRPYGHCRDMAWLKPLASCTTKEDGGKPSRRHDRAAWPSDNPLSHLYQRAGSMRATCQR